MSDRSVEVGSKGGAVAGRFMRHRFVLFLLLAVVALGGACGDSAPGSGEPKEEEAELFPENMVVDFGVVAQGSTKVETFTLTNPRSTPLELSFEIVGDEVAAFELALEEGAGTAVELAPGAEFDLEIGFHAGDPGTTSASLHIYAGEEHGVIALVGESAIDGPRLECTPVSLDFGAVLLGSTMMYSFACTNVGSYIDGSGASEPLEVDSISSDVEAFEARIVDLDGKPALEEAVYLAGEGFRVEVAFSPADEGSVAGSITLKSAAAEGGALSIEVLGRGQAVGRCTQTDEYTWFYPEPLYVFPNWFRLRADPLDRSGDGVVSEEDIELTLDDVARDPTDGDKRIWSYDPLLRMIEFAHLYYPEPGVVGRATYDYACP